MKRPFKRIFVIVIYYGTERITFIEVLIDFDSLLQSEEVLILLLD